MKLDFAEFLAEIDLCPTSPAGLAAAQQLDEAQSMLKASLIQLQTTQKPEEQMLAAVDVALSGIRLNDRKLRVLAYAVREFLDRKS